LCFLIIDGLITVYLIYRLIYTLTITNEIHKRSNDLPLTCTYYNCKYKKIYL